MKGGTPRFDNATLLEIIRAQSDIARLCGFRAGIEKAAVLCRTAAFAFGGESGTHTQPKN